MTASACPVCGTHSDLGCERTDEDEPCPYPEPTKPEYEVQDLFTAGPGSTCIEIWPDGSSTRLSFQIKVF